jgi:hypothetical protein
MNLSRGLIAISLFGLLAGLCGGGRSSPQRTFTSADGAFRFKYSYGLVACKQEAPKNAGEHGEWSCGACNDSETNWKTTACFELPKGALNLNSGTYYGRFVVQEPTNEITEQDCLDAKKGEVRQANDKVIQGVAFKVSHPDQASASASGHPNLLPIKASIREVRPYAHRRGRTGEVYKARDTKVKRQGLRE